MNTNSWTWDEYNTTSNDQNMCENITNHWLFLVFSGYLLPLISPRVREWLKETLNSLKSSDITGDLVTLTEYGFNKIQDIENDKEMKNFIKRMIKSRRPTLLIQEKMYDKLAEEFSGKDGGKSWRYLMKVINNSQNIGTQFARP